MGFDDFGGLVSGLWCLGWYKTEFWVEFAILGSFPRPGVELRGFWIVCSLSLFSACSSTESAGFGDFWGFRSGVRCLGDLTSESRCLGLV